MSGMYYSAPCCCVLEQHDCPGVCGGQQCPERFQGTVTLANFHARFRIDAASPFQDICGTGGDVVMTQNQACDWYPLSQTVFGCPQDPPQPPVVFIFAFPRLQCEFEPALGINVFRLTLDIRVGVNDGSGSKDLFMYYSPSTFDPCPAEGNYPFRSHDSTHPLLFEVIDSGTVTVDWIPFP